MLLVALLVPVAWLLGTFPSALLVARAKGHDITKEGSGNPGTSNVIRVLGPRAGALVLATDVAKGALAAGVGLAAGGRAGAFVLGIAAVLGHTFPIYRRKGGKGVATAGGWLLVTFPAVAAILLGVWLAVVGLTRKASLGSIVITVLFPVLAAAFGYPGVEVAFLCVVAAFVLVLHRGNIVRLVRRQEHDLFGSPADQ
ncbi:MAG TPA: glycerol-3-phosphate 1-O-acyltransferase PlsY [Acidimicrobiia bacterium]|nr:glycerol-3-phosphate 1-O-acyltransferase PlsY [Acidimicrobiia bacterium]